MAFNNSIALAEQFLPLLDEVYKRESLTSVLDAANSDIRFLGGNKVDLYKLSTQGLGDYSRNGGYVDGAVTGTWETLTLTQDRGRRFMVDVMDNEESLGQAFGRLAGEFLRVNVIPEIDAYRFAVLAGAAPVAQTAAADITPGTTDVPALIDIAEEKMNDNEVPQEGRILFVSENAYRGLKEKITRYLANENGVNRQVEMFDGMRVIRVPKGRFYTAITMYDGSTVGEEAGGYVAASGAKAINFMVVHPSAVRTVIKHNPVNIISPEANQTHDGYLMKYRMYHDAFVLANKVNGIYLHKAST